MPYIQINCWPINDDRTAKVLLERVTLAVQQTLACPLDKISIALQEIPPSRWADAGIIGTDPEFAHRSRRLNYEEGMDEPTPDK